MAYPSLSKVLSLRERYSFIPIAETVWSDNLTPIRLFQHIRQPYSFLLESVEGGMMWARYSFIGHQPFLLFRAKGGTAYVEHFESLRGEEGGVKPTRKEKLEGSPFEALKKLLKQFKSPTDLHLPPFSGGAVGYVGYDAVSMLEPVPAHRKPVTDQDEIRLMFCSEMIAFDHLRQEVTFISYLQLDPRMDDGEIKRAYEEKVAHLHRKIEALTARLEGDGAQTFRLPHKLPPVDWGRVDSNFSRERFIQAVEKIKEYIKAGDIFQAVLSQRFSVTTSVSPFDIYRVLRMINPSPYLYYLDLGDGEIVGSSPERLVRVEQGTITVNPIAGTRKRGETPEEDARLAQELLNDEKERAEHYMLLDLGRNDVGRVAQFGSVHVPRLMTIEYFSHVMHIVSTAEGKVRPDCDLIDCLTACFPAGTVTGAPKVRAMQIIAELEEEARHAYSGAIGYFSFTGNMDACIAIRTIFIKDGQAHIQAGAGIVADSVPENEWHETRNKASALLAAIQLAEMIFLGEEKKVHA